MKVILASQSPRRKELLEQIGATFICHASKKEEVATTDVPADLVCELSRTKAEDIASFYGEDELSIIIGADTVVAIDGDILGKPKSREEAISMISRIAGRSHSVFTGVTLIAKKEGTFLWEESFSVETKVSVCDMTKEQMIRYVDSGESMDKAGSYAIQGLFATYIRGIEGDYNNVVGLPVCAIYQRLLELGIDLIG